MSRRCDELAELRSGLVDGALAPADRERLVGHLLGCAACRADVAELRAVRDLLNRSRQPAGQTPYDLSSRLVSIAGEERDRPLLTRAFRRTRVVGLPSRRRRTQLRVTVGVLAVGMVVVLVGFVGWSAAPAADLAGVADPADEARAEFAAAVGELSLAGSSLSALMMLDALPAQTTDGDAVTRPGTGRGRALSPDTARRTLQRATTAEQSVSLAGRQVVVVRTRDQANGDRLTAATIEVDTRQGQGTQLSLLDLQGTRVATMFAPAAVSAVPQTEVFDVLESAYDLAGRSGAVVAGRPATVIEAVRDNQVSKRWWVDDATGVLLWQEGYDDTGAVTVSTGFSSVQLGGPSSGIIGHLPPLTVATGMTTALGTESAAELRRAGWDCDDELAGLDLLELSSDSDRESPTVRSVYGDGLSTITVLQQHGRLTGAPEGATWDAALGAWRHDGAVTWATWQSGDTVLTVTTDGPASMLRTAAASLPREAPVRATTLGRVHDGWSKILADLKG